MTLFMLCSSTKPCVFHLIIVFHFLASVIFLHLQKFKFADKELRKASLTLKKKAHSKNGKKKYEVKYFG